jgi:hypothetical protein
VEDAVVGFAVGRFGRRGFDDILAMVMMQCRSAAAAAAANDGRDGKVCGFDGPNGRCWRSGRNVLVEADAASLVFHRSDRQHLSHFGEAENRIKSK